MFPNQKPWCTGVVRTVLKERNAAFRSGDRQTLYSTARASLKKGIRDAKAAHKRRIEDHFNNNPQRAWQGIQQITNYRGNRSTAADGDTSLAEQLNCFFARFEVSTTFVWDITPSPVCNNSHTLTMQEHEVRQISGVNPSKAANPDGVTGRVLKVCTSQLSAIFTRLFNLSPSKAIVPPCLKSAAIIPLPQKTTISSLNDYRSHTSDHQVL